MKKSLLPLLVMMMPSFSQAELSLDPYFGAGVELQSSTIGTAEFEHPMLTALAGTWVWEGIGFELDLGLAVGDDKQGISTFKNSQLVRYGVRLQTPRSAGETVLYVLLGGATANLDLRSDSSSLPGSSTFSGYHAGIGIGSWINPKLLADISYNNYQVDEYIDLSGVRLSLQYQFGRIAQ